MRQILATMLLLAALGGSAAAQDKVLVIAAPSKVTDAFTDLGCTRITSDPASYSDETMSANVTKINDWMDRAAASSRDATLYVPWGYIAINGTLGADSGITVEGYNDDLPIRRLPSGVSIICGGGWAKGRNNVFVNDRTAGFVCGGNPDQPMIRLGNHGNIISGNFYAYPYVAGDFVAPPHPRCRAAIELYQIADEANCGHHQISGTFTGFKKAIWFHASNNHCDNTDFPWVVFRNCLTDIYCDEDQAKFHTFGHVEHFCPLGLGVLGAYTHSGRVLTQVGAFKDYTWASGDQLYVPTTTGGVVGDTTGTGVYVVASKVNNDSITLEANAGLTANASSVYAIVIADSTSQSTVFDYRTGGDMRCSSLSIVGDYGCTVLRTEQAGSNTGSHLIDGLHVDRALLTATQAGNGRFVLLHHALKSGVASLSGLAVRIRGHMCFGGADNSVENWQNGNGEDTVFLEGSDMPTDDNFSVDWASIKLDVMGADTTTAARFENFNSGDQ